jgi:hypothetical protein
MIEALWVLANLFSCPEAEIIQFLYKRDNIEMDESENEQITVTHAFTTIQFSLVQLNDFALLEQALYCVGNAIFESSGELRALFLQNTDVIDTCVSL